MAVRHNCGFCVAHTLHDVYSFIKALQHRGREAAGIAFIGKDSIDVIKWQGAVNRFDIKDLYTLFPSGKYHTYMAHVRYATRGRKDKILEDAGPQAIGGEVDERGTHVIIKDCDAVMVHNGQVSDEYLENIEKDLLKTDCDTEALLHRYVQEGAATIIQNVPGSYSFAVARKGEGRVLVARDSNGIKPAALGWKDGKYIAASEDISFRKNGGQFISDIEPGYVYSLDSKGNYTKEQVVRTKKKHCYFEWNYISNVDSVLEGVSVRRLREVLGSQLAKEFPLKVDYVTFLPRCPEVAARRYAEKLGIPFIDIFYKTRDERSFLGSTKEERKKSISSNLFLLPTVHGKPIGEALKEKTIAIIDDSAIRGNNSKKAIELLRETVDLKKIYFLNYTPKIGIMGSDGEPRGCVYGVDMPPTDDFIVRGRSEKEVDGIIGADVRFLSMEGMLQGFEQLGIRREELCHYCIGGRKPF